MHLSKYTVSYLLPRHIEDQPTGGDRIKFTLCDGLRSSTFRCNPLCAGFLEEKVIFCGCFSQEGLLIFNAYFVFAKLDFWESPILLCAEAVVALEATASQAAIVDKILTST
jgi:hypothetical protein